MACFENAAAHLAPGGRFLVETMVPELQSLPVGQTIIPFRADATGLWVAQDTGGAIIGPARADIYLGAGEDHGRDR